MKSFSLQSAFICIFFSLVACTNSHAIDKKMSSEKIINQFQVEQIVDAHFRAINARQKDIQSVAIADAYNKNVSFYDPFFEVHGRENISAMYFSLQEKFPNHQFHRIGSIEFHSNSARIHWQVSRDGEPPLHTGEDFMQFKDGKISAVYVFIDGHQYDPKTFIVK